MKSTNLIRQWASYLTEGLKSYDEIMEDDTTIQVDQSTSQKPNIIFCDIDGIIVDIASQDSDFKNTQLNQDQYHIDPKAVEVLKDVCTKTNSKIVIDSAWTWVKNGTKTKMVGTTHKLRSRIPEIKKALGEFLFASEPLTPILSKEEIPGNENVNFDETGFPISANRKLKDGTVKEIPFNISIMKPFCIAKWLDSHKDEIGKYVIVDNNTKSLKWGASKTNYASEMTNALMDMNTSALVSTKGNAILDYFGVEKNDIEDTVDMEVSESDDQTEPKELIWYLFDKDGNVIAYSHDDVFPDFSSACIDAQKNVDKYPKTAYMEIKDRNEQKVNEGENLSSPYDEKINQCVQLAGELIDMARKDPQTFKSIVKTTLDKIDIDPSILSVMNGVKSKMDLFKAAISVAKNRKIKDILKSLYR